jgi:predicted N-formylglutamate amidohydrolase
MPRTQSVAPNAAGASLLAAGEAAAVTVEQADGASDFFFTCDHADARLPQRLGTLGLSDTQLGSHIAYDIGAAGVARVLAARLDATLVLQNYSRLVIDCNRPLQAPDSIARRSEWTQIDGNEHLDDDDIAARTAEIFTPYHDTLADLLDARQRARRRTLLVSIHSFTPTYRGDARPWHVGVMYQHDKRIADVLLQLLRRDERLVIGDNEPYAVTDDTDYTLPHHGQARGLPHVGLEIRQDLIADDAGQKTWGGRLASLFKQASTQLAGS